MPKRWRPPAATPPKPRMDKTASEYVAEMKEQEEAERLKKKGSTKLAEFEKEYGNPDNPSGAIKTPSELSSAAGPIAPKKIKKDKKKDKKKDDKKDKKKDKKKAKKKKKDKKKSSSSSSSSSGSSEPKAKGKLSSKKKKEAVTAETGWKISSFLKAGDSDS
ncbi:PSP [Symbiodinium natans]|uniref:PSP protein n=1 Tax=Symbiodinium natans TaxID=878477 RepID=A0A812TPJ6_9DINO|nr:PSP [Symbiodinium natans]